MIELLDLVNVDTYNKWIDKCYVAARVCYSKKSIKELRKETEEKTLKEKEDFLDNKIFSKGHWSILEHVNLTFVMEDVSRSLTHQQVRHRHLSYSQKSQRYCKLETNEDFIIIPDNLKNNKNVEMITNDLREYISNIQQNLTELGFKEEDIRFIYPNGTKTTLVITGNLRAIIEVMNKRLCSRAQSEIRKEFEELKNILKQKLPKGNILTKYMIPKCKICTEKEDCKINT